MMTSSGSGAYRVGGSLSSSNLSPLAPPFKVDKSSSKQNSMNPSVNFFDGPVYGSCFDPAPGQFWNSSTSSTSGPKCVMTESVVPNTNCSSSPSMYGYQESQSSTSKAGIYYGTGNGVTPFDPFAYDLVPNSMPSNANEAEKSYFVPYVPPAHQKDGYLSLGLGSEAGYDLLSYSGSAHMSGCVSAPVDHAQVMPSDGGYKSKWGSIWSAMGDSEHGNWTDYVQGCASKNLSTSNISSNKTSVFVDGTNKSQPFVDINAHPYINGSSITHLFDDVSNQNHLKKGASLTQDLGLHGQASTAKDYCFDMFGGGCSLDRLVMEQQSCQLLSECAKPKTSASASVTKDAPRLQEPVLDSRSNFCGSQKANVSSPEGHFREPGYFMFGCASTTSAFPKPTSDLPYVGTLSSMGSTLPAVMQNFMGVDADDQSNTAGGYNFTSLDGQMPHGLKSHSSIRIRKPVSSYTTTSSCQTGEFDDSRLDNKAFPEQVKLSSQVSHQSSSDGLRREDINVEAVYSVEKHSAGSDSHNPAEDSPCWKGASSHRFSPFGHSESVDSDVIVQKTESCKSLSSQDITNASIFSNAFGFKFFSSGKVNEPTSLDKPTAHDSTLKDTGDCGSVYPEYHCFDLNAGDDLQFAEGCHASMVGCNINKKSKADKSEALPAEECRNGIPVEDHLTGLTLKIGNNVPHLFPGNKASLKSAGENLNSRSDINVLLRTMKNLSETFRCYCFSNRAEVSEKQALVVKQILCNLNASMLLMSGQTIATTELSPPNKLFLKDFAAVQMVNGAEVLAASLKLGGTTEEIPDCITSKDDENSFEDADMMEAVKKLISDNFQEDDIDQQKLLYKNLWLEAEAKLCVMTAKARFHRMKTELERTQDGVKEKDNPTSSNVPVDQHKDIKPANDNLHSPSLGEHLKPTPTSHIKEVHDPKSQVGRVDLSESERSTSTKKETSFSPFQSSNNKDISCSTSHANDVETCVMARYQILKNRVVYPETLNFESNQPSGEHNYPSSEFDFGNTSSGISVFGGYQILKGQDDNAYSPNYEGQKLPGEENYLPDNDSPNNKALQDSQMSNSLGVTADSEASVIARFRLIQSRIAHSNSLTNDSVHGRENVVLVEDGTDAMGGLKKGNVKTSFGPYPPFGDDEQAYEYILKTNRMSSVIVEGWSDNDCSSDWEHISSRDV